RSMAGGVRDGWLRALLTPCALKAADVCETDQALAASGAPHPQARGGGPPTERVDRDPQELGGLSDTYRTIHRLRWLFWHECLCILGELVRRRRADRRPSRGPPRHAAA